MEKYIFSMDLWDWIGEKNGIDICFDVDKHLFHWMETPSATEWIRQLSPTEAHTSPMHSTRCRNSSWSGCDVQLLHRQHSASPAASVSAVNQNQNSATTAANVSLPRAPGGAYRGIFGDNGKPDLPLAGGKKFYIFVHLWENLVSHSSVTA